MSPLVALAVGVGLIIAGVLIRRESADEMLRLLGVLLLAGGVVLVLVGLVLLIAAAGDGGDGVDAAAGLTAALKASDRRAKRYVGKAQGLRRARRRRLGRPGAEIRTPQRPGY